MGHTGLQGRRDEEFAGWEIDKLPGEACGVEDDFEVAVALDESRVGQLEVGFGELGFDVEVAEGEIDLGAVDCCARGGTFSSWFELCAERDAGAFAEAGLSCGVDVEKRSDRCGEAGAVEDFRVAEDVHQQGVGAGGGIELHPLPVVTRAGPARGGMDFCEATDPVGMGADAGVGGGMKVPVTCWLVRLLFTSKEHGGGRAGGGIV